MKKLKDFLYFSSVFVILVFLFFFLRENRTMEFNFPELDLAEVTAQEEAEQQKAQEVATRTRTKRIFSCVTDDDCIIVDKDPCGCIIGPKGVIAINVNHMVDFLENQRDTTEACPNREPSQVAQCSPSARGACRNNVCTIVF